MTTPDRSDELIRAMLERRAGAPLPGWLLDSTMHAVRAAPQDHAGHPPGWWPALPTGTGARLALVAALVTLTLALVGGAALAAGLLDGFLDPQPNLPAVIVEPERASPPPMSSPSSDPAATVQPSETPAPPTPPPAADALEPDTLAVVTRDGDGLRVRSAAGLDSPELSPHLAAGTRMFVISGPVAADGHDWYEVQTDDVSSNIDLYGWVAAADKDGGAWIKPKAPACPKQLDGRAIAETSPMDLLVCLGEAQFQVVADGITFAIDTDDDPCPWSPGHGACSVDPSWMTPFVDLHVGEIPSAPGDTGGVLIASAVVAPDAQDAVYSVGNATDIRVTLSTDPPEARDCRFVDESGKKVGLRAHAVLECRLRLVIRAVEWEEREEPAEELPPDSLATVEGDGLDLWSSPDEATQEHVGRLDQGSLIYVDQRLPAEGPAEWYAVLKTDDMLPLYGWIRAPQQGGQLWPEYQDCAPMMHWESFVSLGRYGQLACMHADPVTLDMYVWEMQAARPEWSAGCNAWGYLAPGGSAAACSATPEWLSTFSGIAIRRPGDMEMFAAYDPSVIDRSEFPQTETWLQVTGSWEWPTSSECRVQDPTTGVDLLPPEQAAIYCRATFVITGIGPATTSP
jgi:hypothetical protein